MGRMTRKQFFDWCDSNNYTGVIEMMNWGMTAGIALISKVDGHGHAVRKLVKTPDKLSSKEIAEMHAYLVDYFANRTMAGT